MRLFAILPVLLAGAASAQTPPPAAIDGLPIGAIPTQALPAKGCAAFLWTASGTRALVAMAGADPAQLRLSIGGTLTDLPRTEEHDPGGYGFAGTTQYQAGDVTAVLTMSIATARRPEGRRRGAGSDAQDRPDGSGQHSGAGGRPDRLCAA